MPIARYQQGCVTRVKRAKGPDVWVYRWREDVDGVRCLKSRTVGTVKEYRTKADALRAVESLRAKVNAVDDRAGMMTIADAWGHFQKNELENSAEREQTTVDCYMSNYRVHIIPRWGSLYIGDLSPIEVEQWLRSLPNAPGTKAKIRNQMSALFRHLIRWRLFHGANPMQTVRQSSARVSDPEILTFDEMRILLGCEFSVSVRLMLVLAASTGLRRSEIRGLKWADVDCASLWIRLKRGVVNKLTTRMKTRASRKGVPMLPQLAQMFTGWRATTPYSGEDDYVFASIVKKGRSPLWPDMVMKNHIRPAARGAGITKEFAWHTFRHSFSSELGRRKEDPKTIQALMRHADVRMTLDVYQQADHDNMRGAQAVMTDLFTR